MAKCTIVEFISVAKFGLFPVANRPQLSFQNHNTQNKFALDSTIWKYQFRETHYNKKKHLIFHQKM